MIETSLKAFFKYVKANFALEIGKEELFAGLSYVLAVELEIISNIKMKNAAIQQKP